MIKELWNVGLKVTDLDREVAFLRDVGASLVLRERVSMVGEEREYAILILAGVRMLLFETVVFEKLVSGGVRPGLTHAVRLASVCSFGTTARADMSRRPTGS